MLVVSGGVSVGPHDHVKPAFEACGVEEVFWRVRIKPGKPLWFGRRGDDARVRAAGQPAVGDRLLGVFVVPALRRLQRRARRPARGSSRGRLGEPAGPSDGRTTFLISRARARAPTACSWRTPTERQGSHMTGALGESDGFAIAPHHVGALPAGAPVDVLRLGSSPVLDDAALHGVSGGVSPRSSARRPASTSARCR